MLLSITTTRSPANDLGYLLHKHPDKFQSFDLSFGTAHAYYPEVGEDRCTACLLLDVDAVGLVRGRNPDQDFLLAQYVNDRPYVASSFLSVAIAQVFGSALQGRCKDRPELVTTPLPLEARLDVLPVRGGEGFLRAVFEPLGYEVEAVRHPLDERFPEWGESPIPFHGPVCSPLSSRAVAMCLASANRVRGGRGFFGPRVAFRYRRRFARRASPTSQSAIWPTDHPPIAAHVSSGTATHSPGHAPDTSNARW
jgi:hypothetical protein